ncbi:class I SAM-dependent methyltransferase [Methanocella sp. CWC-04]|uniref:Class I SAM-dependent methyltransferase n=1 Tax=Methanooceanicella nereidis TaxID=2052831 RepID=A0AAP2W5F1_9EURY|nr:class I SAM-dependent methyltransferase [Methanocella sp. CWC-04]MCD1295425.1 class I SAM-dependent methyltransferase [Methanocella sp. CWC-04]
MDENTKNWFEYWHQATPAIGRGPRQASFWDKRAEKYGDYVSSDRKEGKLRTVLDFIQSTGLKIEDAEVLDIGSGPGTFALPLAKMGAKVTAVDISAEMLKRLEKSAAEDGISNIKTIHSAWKDIDLDSMGFKGKFDLVIASMTPGINGPETFDMMLDASKGVCYYSGWVNRKWDSSYNELYKMLFNEEFREITHGFYLPFMYLYTMGYRPEIKIKRDIWNSDETVEDMVETVSGFFSSTKDIDEEMKGRMREYFQERSNDGKYRSETIAVTGMMVWEKNNK